MTTVFWKFDVDMKHDGLKKVFFALNVDDLGI